MSDETIKKLEQRLSDLESRFDKQPPKAPKPPRAPSEYNKFMADYVAKNKDPKKPHKELFAEAVKAWNLKKK
jgi:hypothetical protein